ncbi:hypothetical protein SLS56_009839 [Neofusicoccum ribis]|uniref:Calcineurin-like phosphoesterase domain-containing protein n=1 Tax=Neofusicoccum ribis TaxID=45134 RepID=A0ABR3SGN8_9PEZI
MSSVNSSYLSPGNTIEPIDQQRKEEESIEHLDVKINDGYAAWSQVLVSFLIVVNGFGYFSAFGLFQSHWMTRFQKSAADISWVGSLSLFLLFFLGTLSGSVMDRGHFRSILVVGCIFQLLGVFASSVVSQYWQLLLSQGIVQGIGNGLLFTPCVALVSTYFEKKRAFALSLAACGAPVGGPLVDLEAFKAPIYLFFSIGIFFVLWGVYIAYFYTTTFGKEVIGISDASSLTLLMVLNAVGIPGRIVPAYMADRYFGTFNTLLPFVGGASVMLFAWIRVYSTGSFYAFVTIYGICANAVQTLFPSTLSQLNTDMSKMASHVGMVFTVGSIACLTGPPIAGCLIDLGKAQNTDSSRFIFNFTFTDAGLSSFISRHLFATFAMTSTSEIRIQVLSDLHLEKPPAYDIFEIAPAAPHLALFGDIGEARDDGLYRFLHQQLQRFQTVFFLLGNHEPFHNCWFSAISRLRHFEMTVEEERRQDKSLEKFILLDKTRVDLSWNLTILGCTLYTHVRSEHHDHISFGLNDFYYIEDWTVEQHTAAHVSDVAWLNEQVTTLATEEPHRKIIIFTHHSPTSDPRTMKPENANSKLSSGFLTDLSAEPYWTFPNVKVWAYGHTHFNCDFADENTNLSVFSNQRGYYFSQAQGFDIQKTLSFVG